MASYVKFQDFAEQLLKGHHGNLDTSDIKVALTNTLPVNTQTSFDPTTNHAAPGAANGYTARGNTVAGTVSESGGTAKLVLADTTWTATTGGIGPIQYAVLYSEDPTAAPADPLIAYWDYGSSITIANGETFTVDFDDTAGVLTLA